MSCSESPHPAVVCISQLCILDYSSSWSLFTLLGPPQHSVLGLSFLIGRRQIRQNYLSCCHHSHGSTVL